MKIAPGIESSALWMFRASATLCSVALARRNSTPMLKGMRTMLGALHMTSGFPRDARKTSGTS